jgi:hypothetical protein
MLRFRNRFQGAPSDLLRCRCGLLLTTSGEPGRQTIIHELPWCDAFRAAIEQLQASDPTARLHQALVVADADKGIDTLIVADGDRIEDVETAAPVPHPSQQPN